MKWNVRVFIITYRKSEKKYFTKYMERREEISGGEGVEEENTTDDICLHHKKLTMQIKIE